MQFNESRTKLRGDLGRLPTRRFLWLSTGILFCFHFVLWAMIGSKQASNITSIFDNWDAAWYLEIATQGYIQPASWAFYPGFPFLLRGLTTLLPDSVAPAAAGVYLSTALFGVFLVLLGVMINKKHLFAPQTKMGWLVFLLFPCSYVFHSTHSESLFLLLFATSLYFFSDRRFVLAAIFAGVAALTRNEGVLLAAALGLGSIGLREGKDNRLVPESKWQRLKRLSIFAVISGSIWSAYPLYQYLTADEPTMFLKAQHFWTSEISIQTYFRTFWFGNPWQNTNFGSIIHHAFFFALSIGIVWLSLVKRDSCMTIFLFLFMVIRPLQGELVSTLRFETVLFPLLFFLGDRLSVLTRRWQYAILVFFLVLNWQVTRNYGYLRWAY